MRQLGNLLVTCQAVALYACSGGRLQPDRNLRKIMGRRRRTTHARGCSQRKKIVAANVPLTKAEAVKVWPVYDPYVVDHSNIYDTRYALI